MSHVNDSAKKIKIRLKKIKGQLDAVEKCLDSDKECAEVLQTLAAARGAINSLFGELVEEHIQEHIINTNSKDKKSHDQAAMEVIKLIKTYWK